MKYSIQAFCESEVKNEEELEIKLYEFGTGSSKIITEFTDKDAAVTYFRENYYGENIPAENKATVRKIDLFVGKSYEVNFFGVVATTENEEEYDKEFEEIIENASGDIWLCDHEDGRNDFLLEHNIDDELKEIEKRQKASEDEDYEDDYEQEM